ncbi:retron St85 family RNA-directed DNA polymerase [Pseudoduganella violacea]|uniref:RNA-directed DNA polymerase n=1 Tax=Pseudoduganella violacea TaxID=1715466 RepID=A0A7W5B6Y0_9BURK|nr:retron St85 family RNA-directed DNA polymerase [Pseudoduganella violacea]MBB3117658.1 retron-type reverse transcriptase [Pseudoduganella violacea]
MSLASILANKLVMSNADLFGFVLTMPRRYKQYKIFKRNGIETRHIAQPSKEAKFIQRIIVEELRKLLPPIHKAATAYEPGTGIKANALRHLNSRYLLKMDFKNFFPSITPEFLFLAAESSGIKFDELDKILLENALFYKSTRRARLRMSIGAPSSPFISNFVMSGFDNDMFDYCAKRNISYTRYADDLTFTTNEKDVLFEIPKIVESTLINACFRKIRINSKKTIFSSKKYNRHVTGVVLTSDGQLSVGRARKREVSSLINSFKYGKLDEKERLHLKGLIAHVHHIEPDFIFKMRKKYSDEVVNSLMKPPTAG